MAQFDDKEDILAAAAVAAARARALYDIAAPADRDKARKIADQLSRAVILLRAKKFNEATPEFAELADHVEEINKQLKEAKENVAKVSQTIEKISTVLGFVEKALMKLGDIAL